MSTLARLCGAPATEERDVDFEIECDDFAVPEWPGLRCSATYRVCGYVEIDHSGDHETPDGPPSPHVMLMDPTMYAIYLDGEVLPEWLQQRLATDDMDKLDSAFLAAIGGQCALDDLAVEHACV